MAKILVVDDDITMLQMVVEKLRSDGHEVFPFSNGIKAVESIDSINPDIVVTDLYLDKTNQAYGLEVLKKARSLVFPAIVIVVTGYGSVETAVEAMKLGAFDYIEKPFKLDEFRLCIKRALDFYNTITENFYLKQTLKQKYHFNQIVGASLKMQEVFKIIERVANTDSTVLILGESGTGKELVARALHFNSRRQNGRFVPINCSALPEYLLESELFGHRKGAFTGAIHDKKGLFEEANGGTIFLDEIATMSPVLQSRLLRVLQEGEVRRVGDNNPIYVNVRVVAATNENLEQRVKEGKFREDLYYRLNVIPIKLPPLRERKDDIPLLVAHFLKNKKHPITGKPFHVTKAAMDALMSYNWPGNVRELENAIERATALSDDEVINFSDLPSTIQETVPHPSKEDMKDVASLPDQIRNNLSHSKTVSENENSFGMAKQINFEMIVPLKDFIKKYEREYINNVISRFNGDKEKAANALGISLATLYRKLSEED